MLFTNESSIPNNGSITGIDEEADVEFELRSTFASLIRVNSINHIGGIIVQM